ncbi:MAG: hypothetical protein FD180_1082 [Planctomycetota bacterium]|nr:MAG: hypothetical protein FD180_1082 [Planctomycetota bacterium]
MRVVLFFDGKNFYAGWKDQAHGRDVDFKKLSQWVVRAVGGTHLMGAYYYTGVDDSLPRTPGQEKLDGFLDMLAQEPGFFVQRFAQRNRTHVCSQCQAPHTFSQEKEVDTTIVADMLRLGAVGGFDIAVLVSGDADLTPAVEGVRSLGKQVYVASWGQSGLSSRIRRAAFDHVDLMQGLPEFARGAGDFARPANDHQFGSATPAAQVSNDPEAYVQACFEEIKRAQATMPGGYIGAHFFVTKWRSSILPELVDLRRRALDLLVERGQAEVYLTDDGIQAVRLKG